MATVSSAWLGTPTAPGIDTSQRTRKAAEQGQVDSMGYLDSDQRQKQTGVNTGQGGYVSGQVAPAGATAATSTGVPRGTTSPTVAAPVPTAPTGAFGASPTTVRNGSVAQPIQIAANGTHSGYAPNNDITTVQSALSTSPGTTTTTGTTNGKSAIPTKITYGQGT